MRLNLFERNEAPSGREQDLEFGIVSKAMDIQNLAP
jgi:hypothetical protein